jgi:hypothetical protein
MGETGITLAFLEGASARIERRTPSVDSARKLMHQMIDAPRDGFVTEVRWCGTVDAPVLSVAEIESSEVLFKSSLSTRNGIVSLGFSQDIHSMFGLNCTDSRDCLEKLVTFFAAAIEASQCSRILDVERGTWIFGDFQPKELDYIDCVAVLCSEKP